MALMEPTDPAIGSNSAKRESVHACRSWKLYCYNLDKSIAEMRSDLVRDHGEADLKLKALEKHVQEVHRSVQILRDKQELAETQKELAKLQFAQKEIQLQPVLQQNEDRNAQPVSDSNKGDNSTDVHGQQLALALPHQVAPRAPLTNRPAEQPQQPPPPIPSQKYDTVARLLFTPCTDVKSTSSNSLVPRQVGQYLSSGPQYRTSQMQDLSRLPPQPAAPQGNQAPQIQSMPQYQQQWAQQQARPTSPAAYPSYPPSQPNPSPEASPIACHYKCHFLGSSISCKSFDAGRPTGSDRSGRPLSHSPRPIISSLAWCSRGWVCSCGPPPSLSAGNAYLMYDSEGTRVHPQQPPNFPQSGYAPPASSPEHTQSSPSPSLMVRPPQLMRTHPYNELIEKLAKGYRGDHVVNVIQRLG
ncbi:hypothetical protein HAX54_009829 [Datura stramonium]|uniref:Uncharacterized protein n=1 Tax=Datura stramonium TaxID=4076 RepID=A0ABS8WY32_DATST|nr:hypothetical protein [Datura stramonium]